jgi:hypothetical protein
VRSSLERYSLTPRRSTYGDAARPRSDAPWSAASGQQGLGTQARDAPRRARILAVDGRECRCLRAAAAATVVVRIGRELCQKPKSSPVRRSLRSSPKPSEARYSARRRPIVLDRGEMLQVPTSPLADELPYGRRLPTPPEWNYAKCSLAVSRKGRGYPDPAAEDSWQEGRGWLEVVVRSTNVIQ